MISRSDRMQSAATGIYIADIRWIVSGKTIAYRSMFFFMLLGLMTIGFGQKASNSLSQRNMIGFGCGFSAKKTKATKQMIDFIKGKNYKAIRNKLTSRNTASQFLAVLVVSKLDSLGAISLKEKELGKIQRIKKSEKEVNFCSGCTDWRQYSLKTALDQNSFCFKFSDYWIRKELGIFNVSYHN